jgi:hypothetical protein
MTRYKLTAVGGWSTVFRVVIPPEARNAIEKAPTDAPFVDLLSCDEIARSHDVPRLLSEDAQRTALSTDDEKKTTD